MSNFQVSLFSCFSDFGVCCIGCFVPCYLLAVNVARVDGRDCHVCDCCCMTNPNWVVRQRVRSKYGLEWTFCSDCCVVAFCGCCSSVQHANEMKARESLLTH